MALTAIHKYTLLEDCDNILFLILTEPACDRSLDFNWSSCMRDGCYNNFYSLDYHAIVLGHGVSTFKENTNVFLILLYYYYWFNCFICPSTCILYVCVI